MKLLIGIYWNTNYYLLKYQSLFIEILIIIKYIELIMNSRTFELSLTFALMSFTWAQFYRFYLYIFDFICTHNPWDIIIDN